MNIWDGLLHAPMCGFFLNILPFAKKIHEKDALLDPRKIEKNARHATFFFVSSCERVVWPQNQLKTHLITITLHNNPFISFPFPPSCWKVGKNVPSPLFLFYPTYSFLSMYCGPSGLSSLPFSSFFWPFGPLLFTLLKTNKNKQNKTKNNKQQICAKQQKRWRRNILYVPLTRPSAHQVSMSNGCIGHIHGHMFLFWDRRMMVFSTWPFFHGYVRGEYLCWNHHHLS